MMTLVRLHTVSNLLTLHLKTKEWRHAGLDWDIKSALAFFRSRRPTTTSNYTYIYSRSTCTGPIVRRPTGKMPGMPDYQSSPGDMLQSPTMCKLGILIHSYYDKHSILCYLVYHRILRRDVKNYFFGEGFFTLKYKDVASDWHIQINVIYYIKSILSILKNKLVLNIATQYSWT